MNRTGLAISRPRAADLGEACQQVPSRLARPRHAALLMRRRSRFERLRLRLQDGRLTTMHVAAYRLDAFTPRVVALQRPLPLARWCREQRVRHALVGGFFVRASGTPLGELWIDGERRCSEPFAEPWGRMRACVQIHEGAVRIAARPSLPAAPTGDLLQAGPLLLAGGRVALQAGDPEGFSAGAHQFDSDITAGRYPRAAMGLADGWLLAVACDGRTNADAGLTLAELALALKTLGARDAINLDGGGSASLVYGGRLRNRPREEHGLPLLEGRPILTAIALEPRRG